VLKINPHAAKANGTSAPSSLGKRQERDDDSSPAPNKRASPPPRDTTPKANGHANGSLAKLANYGSTDDEGEQSMPGSFPTHTSQPPSPRRSAPGSPKKRKHKNHHADPKRGLHGVSKGAPMPFAVGRMAGKNKNPNMRTNGMLGPKGSPSKRETQLGRQKGVFKRMQGK
jgi:hypothetical protein